MGRTFLTATMLVSGLLLSAPAHAVFVDTSNNFLSVTQPVTITFTFAGKSANNIDLLVDGSTTIFNNQTASVGTTFTTLFGPGQFLLQLRNSTTGTLYSPGTANSDGQVHLKSTTDFSDFSIGSTTVLAGLNGYYGFEDSPITPGGMASFNDLVFTVTVPTGSVVPPITPIPEPMSLAVLGVGLVGLARMRKGKSKA